MNLLLAIDFENLHTLLRSLYDEMMPLKPGLSRDGESPGAVT